MFEPLTLADIDEDVKSQVFVQDYASKDSIEGVQLIPLKNHVGEGGDFSEIVRVNPQGELAAITGFTLRQVSRSTMLPGTIKAWHIHLKQDDVWYVPPSSVMFVGLRDVRKNSATSGKMMRLALGGGESKLLLIPRGVAHGAANFTSMPIELFYFVNAQFNMEDPDERRLPWDAFGESFWSPAKE